MNVRTVIKCILALYGLIILVVSCDTFKSVYSYRAVDVTAHRALLRGYYSHASSECIDDFGFLYGESPSVELKISKDSLVSYEEQFFQFRLNNLKPSTKYYFCSYLIVNDRTYRSDIKSFTTTEAFVDLGLSVKWSVMNIGANTLESKGVLCEYDLVESRLMGGESRLPTICEWEELKDKCTWTKATKKVIYTYYMQGDVARLAYHDIDGYDVTSNVDGYTDRSIFIPILQGYWSHELSTRTNVPFYLVDQMWCFETKFGLRLVQE